MLKLRIQWKLETGEEFNEWTRPLELAMAEKELYNNSSIIKILLEEDQASSTLLLFLAHKMQQRITKKNENFETWQTKVTDIRASEVDTANFTKPDQSGAQQ